MMNFELKSFMKGEEYRTVDNLVSVPDKARDRGERSKRIYNMHREIEYYLNLRRKWTNKRYDTFKVVR